MADSKLTGLTAASTVATTDLLYAGVDPGGTPLSRKITIATLFAALAEATISPAAALTTSQPFTLEQTWNAAGVTFIGRSIDITDTASAAGSLVERWRVGGSTIASIGKTGILTVGGGAAATPSIHGATANSGIWFFGNNTRISADGNFKFNFDSLYFNVTSAGGIRWSSGADPSTSLDLVLVRDAANTLAQRNGTAAQAFRIYNTWTSAAENEHLSIGWATNVLTIGTVAAGGGTKRNIVIDGANRAAFVADATDLASVITLANALKASQISHGLMAAS